MKVIISHVYSNHNKGDAALLSVLIGDIRRAFKDPEITILSLDKVKEVEIFDGAQVRNSFMYYARDSFRNSVLKILNAVYVGTATLIWALIYRYFSIDLPISKDLRSVINLYQESDLIIPVGGGYVRSKAGFSATVTLFFIIHPFLFSRILGKKTVAYSQSVGPFGNKIQECMSKFAIKRLNGIIVRENISLDLLRKWGIEKNVFKSVDSGFSFVGNSIKNIRKDLQISNTRLLVGITVRSWLKNNKQINYERVIAKLADYIINKYGAYIIFIPQVTFEHHADDDRESSKRVYNFIESKNNAKVVIDNFNHHEIKSIYGSLDYLIGTRFHSVIFALTSYVPSIAIGYEHKTLGIMTDVGLKDWVIDIEKIKLDELISLFDGLVNNREQYIAQLKKILPAYIKESEKSIYFVKNI